MATIQVSGRVRNGVIELTAPLDVPDGTEVIVTVSEAAAVPPPAVPDPAHPFFGMWADREDMADPVEWLRKQREEEWRRRTSAD